VSRPPRSRTRTSEVGARRALRYTRGLRGSESGRPESNGPLRSGAPALCRLSYVRVRYARLDSNQRPLPSQGSARDPLSFGRSFRRSLRQELNPHFSRTKGACLPLTLRRRDRGRGIHVGSGREATAFRDCPRSESVHQRIPICAMNTVETVGIEPTPCSVQARGTLQSASPRVRSSGDTGRRSTSMDPCCDQDSDAAYGAHLSFDHGVSCRQNGGHAVAAVTHDERVALACESHGRCLATLLEPLSIQLERRRAEAGHRAPADADLVERCPDRLVRVHGSSSPRSAIRRCGRVESNHHSLRRRGYSALSSPVLSVRKANVGGGTCFPQPARSVARALPAPSVACRHACQPPPWTARGMPRPLSDAGCTLRPSLRRAPAVVPSLPRAPRRQPDPCE